MIRSVTVFCGSNHGFEAIYTSAARELGALLARSGISIVYGGGSVGLMGELADSALAAGGEVIGIIPRALWEREVGHRALSKLHVVETMHARKEMMASLADAFIALPGGLGTLEEIFEVWTWAQLGIHRKPLGFLEVNGFWSPLMQFLDRSVTAGFLRPQHRAIAFVEGNAEALLQRFAAYEAPSVQKWMTKEEA
jgi:uncharacterized protein (TIGR00730 family)